MTEKEIWGFVDECLENYPANLARLDTMKKNLQILRMRGDVQAQNYVRIYNHDSRTRHSDPVPVYVESIQRIEKEIERLTQITEPITRMIEDLRSPYSLDSSLNSDFLEIMGLGYFGRNNVASILDTTGMSRAGYFRKKKQLAGLARSYLGL